MIHSSSHALTGPNRSPTELRAASHLNYYFQTHHEPLTVRPFISGIPSFALEEKSTDEEHLALRGRRRENKQRRTSGQHQ